MNKEIEEFLNSFSRDYDYDLLSSFKHHAIFYKKEELIKYFCNRKIRSSLGLYDFCKSYVRSDKKNRIFNTLVDSGIYDKELENYLPSLVKTNQLSMVRKIIDKGIDVNQNEGECLLIVTKYNNFQEHDTIFPMARLLINNGASLDFVSLEYLYELMETPSRKEIVSFLIEQKKESLYKNTKVLKWLINNKEFQLAEEFIKKGSNIKWLMAREKFDVKIPRSFQKFLYKNDFVSVCLDSKN